MTSTGRTASPVPAVTKGRQATGLRFAMVTTFYPPHHFGGDSVFIRRLAHALARRGHRVDVIHDVDAYELLRRGPRPEPLSEPAGVHTHPLRSRAPALACLATHQTGRPLVHGRRIRRLIERSEPDVIHFHNVSLVGGPGVLSYGSAIKLYMAHEHWLVCPTHVLWRHDRELCTGRQCLRCSLNHRRPPQLWRHTGLLRRKIAQIDAFISPSAFSAAKHREFGFGRDMEVLPYFLPDPARDAESATDDHRDGHERPYFLFVGRLEKIKGLQEILPHFGDAAPADLLVVGSGGYEETLRRQAAGLGRVRFLGTRRPAELRPLYRRALALLAPSICYETFGITIIEAFRDRTPVVARALGPATEIVRDSGGGLLFESPGELSSALARLAGDAELRARLGAAGRRAFVENWTETAVLPGYLALIRRLAAERGDRDLVGRIDASAQAS